MSRAVCLRCGADKPSYDRICPDCGHRPDGEGLLVAWLLSDAHLPASHLDQAAARIRRGEALRPSHTMLQRARRALGVHATQDHGLDWHVRFGLLSLSLFITALPGLLMWFWWRTTRPRSAAQALWLSLPAGLIGSGALLWLGLAARLGW